MLGPFHSPMILLAGRFALGISVRSNQIQGDDVCPVNTQSSSPSTISQHSLEVDAKDGLPAEAAGERSSKTILSLTSKDPDHPNNWPQVRDSLFLFGYCLTSQAEEEDCGRPGWDDGCRQQYHRLFSSKRRHRLHRRTFPRDEHRAVGPSYICVPGRLCGRPAFLCTLE